ncbi:MAG TPA: Gfo/Idh/MocA family oxidoreductase [Candidatus Latescibacteria bacterium]|nr:Gfo/Idh/MocA family oxidoreductase [Candidatus Latescibacterota bacterium]
MEKKTCLMLGAGGMAGWWIRNAFPRFVDRMTVVGLVDIRENVLHESGNLLGIPESARFTDMEEAFAKTEADFCVIVTPPWVHEQAVMLAVGKRMAILSEKPIADSWKACTAIYRAVAAAGLKMEVIQNYRYEPTMLTVRHILRSGRLGRVNYIVGRFADDYRRYGSWGQFRHEIPHSLLVEGGVHHLDMLRNLSGGDTALISGSEWNPPWSSFKGESNALFTLTMTNSVRAQYEGSCNEAGVVNGWHREYYRVECEYGSVTVDSDLVVRIWERSEGRSCKMTEVPLLNPTYAGHLWQLDEFLSWLDGGREPDTVLSDNMQSAATMFAAIVASDDAATVDVQKMVRAAMQA